VTPEVAAERDVVGSRRQRRGGKIEGGHQEEGGGGCGGGGGSGGGRGTRQADEGPESTTSLVQREGEVNFCNFCTAGCPSGRRGQVGVV